MKKTIVLDEKLDDFIQRMRGEIMKATGKDLVSFSNALNFFAWLGLERLSQLDKDALEKRLKLLILPQEEIAMEESLASLWDKIREKFEKGEIAIYPKKSS